MFCCNLRNYETCQLCNKVLAFKKNTNKNNDNNNNLQSSRSKHIIIYITHNFKKKIHKRTIVTCKNPVHNIVISIY